MVQRVRAGFGVHPTGQPESESAMELFEPVVRDPPVDVQATDRITPVDSLRTVHSRK
jgi:hypothetical protein